MSQAQEVEIKAVKRESRFRSFLKELSKNKVAFIALIFLVLIHVVVFLGPFIWTVNPDSTDPRNALASWSLEHPLGTDDLGRDVFSRMLAGGQITLLVGFASMVFTVIVGGLIGAIAGYFGGWIDTILMRFTEAMLSVPNFFLVLVALTVLGKSPFMVIIVIALTSWMEIARVIYGETLRWKESEFVEASASMGSSYNVRIEDEPIEPDASTDSFSIHMWLNLSVQQIIPSVIISL